MERKLEKEVRSGDKELEVFHIEVIVEAERGDEVIMEVERMKKRTENRSLVTGRERGPGKGLKEILSFKVIV